MCARGKQSQQQRERLQVDERAQPKAKPTFRRHVGRELGKRRVRRQLYLLQGSRRLHIQGGRQHVQLGRQRIFHLVGRRKFVETYVPI